MAYFNKKRKGTANFMRGNVGGGFETRGQQDDPIDQSGYGSAPTAPIGQMQSPIGQQSLGQTMLGSWLAGGGVGENWNQMSDIYNDYQSYLDAQHMYMNQDSWTFSPTMTGYDTVDDWWANEQAQYGAGYNWWTNFGPGSSSSYAQSATVDPMTGGSQGGFGDLGQGSIFNPGFTNPWGEGWGPEGQGGYGDPYELDPNWNPWGDQCWDQYMAMGDAGLGGEFDSYEDFAGVYCG